MRIKCYAKINLSLDVIKKLDNGYHQLEMVMAPINLFDILDIEISDTMIFECNRNYVLNNPTNTIVKAVEILREKYHFKENFKINLKKYIPTKAGLAGGSSDGAMVIKAINELLNLKMSYEEIKEVCLKLGADVLFTYFQIPAYVTGVGEELEFIKAGLKLKLLVIKPSIGMSSKKAFERLKFDKLKHVDTKSVLSALKKGDYPCLIKNMANSLEAVVFEIQPALAQLKKELESQGFDLVLMSGSGTSLMCFTLDTHLLEKVCDLYRQKGYFARVCEMVGNNNEIY